MSEHLTLAARLKKRIRDAVAANHREMDKGVAPESYNRLVGRNAQLRQVNDWISEELKTLGLDEDDYD